jgi:hypothetical protein
VRGVRIERRIGDHAEFGHRRFHGANRARDQSIRIPRFGTIGRLQVRFDFREQRNGGDAKTFVISLQLIHRAAFAAGHRHGHTFVALPSITYIGYRFVRAGFSLRSCGNSWRRFQRNQSLGTCASRGTPYVGTEMVPYPASA